MCTFKSIQVLIGAAALLVLSIVGCVAAPTDPAGSAAGTVETDRSRKQDSCGGPPKPVRYATLEQYRDGPYAIPFVKLIRSAAEWDAWIEELLRAGAMIVMPVPPPDVDWKKGPVVVVSMGERTSLGYSIEIVKIWRQGACLSVQVELTTPSGGECEIPSMCAPYHMVQLEGNPDVTSVTMVTTPPSAAGLSAALN
jgi:hypothetical protein